MTTYTLGSNCILRDDGAIIPLDPANRDYAEFLDWQSAGNTPAPAKTLDPKLAVQAQIDQTERDTLMNRGAREGWMEVIREKAAAAGVTDDAVIAANNPFFSKLLDVDTRIRALRAQLT